MRHNQKDWAPEVGALLFFGTFALYLSTIAPTVTFWDSGELIAASYTLGIPHQPGYPFFCLIGRLFSFFPFGNIAFRVNVLSAAFSSLTVTLVYFTILSLIRGRYFPPPPMGEGEGGGEKSILTTLPQPPPINGGGLHKSPYPRFDGQPVALAALLALVLAVVRAFWSEAVVTEVYALNAFIVSLLVFLYVKARSGSLPCARYMALSGLLFGIGVVNHMSLILYLPALVLTWALLPGGCRPKWVIAALGFFLLGQSVYIYLPIRSLAGAALDIGHPETLPSLWYTLKWGHYISHAGGSLASLAALLKKLHILDPRVLAGCTAAVFFLWRLLKSDWRLYLPPFVYLAVYSLGISTQVLGGEEDIRFGLAAKFYIPAFILTLILIGAASGDLLGSKGGRRAARVFAASLLLAVSVLACRNYYPNDCSRNYMAYDYAGNSLKSADNGGVLFTWGDNGVFPLWYLQIVERYRDDVLLVHSPLMTYGWYLCDLEKKFGKKPGFIDPYFLGENVFRILKAARPEREVAYDYSSPRFLKLDLAKLNVRGLVYYEGMTPPGDPWSWYVFRGVNDPGVYKDGMEKNIIAIYDYQRSVSGHPALLRDGHT